MNIDEIHTEAGDVINTGENIGVETAKYFANQFKKVQLVRNMRP